MVRATSDREGFEISTTIIIPTFERRTKLLTLLNSLDEALSADVSVEVVVVVDGSTDGTIEALTELSTTYPLRWKWQPNQGVAVARNTGIEMARGRVCWFIDDDKTVDAASAAAHVRFHDETGCRFALMGPTWEERADQGRNQWSQERIDRFTVAGKVEHPADFRSGNTSIPRDLLVDLGGFSEAFRGWGEEDVELGYRLHKRGVAVHFDRSAATWHDRVRTPLGGIAQERERGHNLATLAELHPEAVTRPPVGAATPRVLMALYDRNVRSGFLYGAIAQMSALVLRLPPMGADRTRAKVARIGVSAARLAGLLEAGAGPDVVEAFGFPQRRSSDRAAPTTP